MVVFVKDYGKCPITGEPLSLDDIVQVKAGKVCALLLFLTILSFVALFMSGYNSVMLELQIVKPRPVQAASIPGMIGMFQNVCSYAILDCCLSVYILIY